MQRSGLRKQSVADVLIVAGTSTQVYPAAGLISMANAVIKIDLEATAVSGRRHFLAAWHVQGNDPSPPQELLKRVLRFSARRGGP